MKRDEAKRIHRTYDNCSSDREMEDNLTLWCALGMLKLDEPLSREDRIDRLLAALGPTATAKDVDYYADEAGLRIVEK